MILNDSFNHSDIANWDKRFRANFFHAAIGVKPAILIGSSDGKGISNLAIFSSVFHLGSNPPIFGFMLRPTDVKRDTLDNILALGSYSMSLFQSHLVTQAHQTSAKYPADACEFEKVGIEKDYWEGVPVPAKVPLAMKLQFLEVIPIKHNETQLVLGQVVAVKTHELAIEEDGLLLHQENDIVGVTGLDSYYASKKLKRLSYARPDSNPIEL